VKFTSEELWGPDAGAVNTVVHIDLWEPYLTTP
jgi:nitrile hydratase subunit beta